MPARMRRALVENYRGERRGGGLLGVRFRAGAHDALYSGRDSEAGMSSLRFTTFDVRPMLARGEEPCAAIRAKVDKLAPGHGLMVIAPFFPAPMVEVLKSEGFSSSLERRTDGGWAVGFWRECPPTTK
jgi:hypothetical protein